MKRLGIAVAAIIATLFVGSEATAYCGICYGADHDEDDIIDIKSDVDAEAIDAALYKSWMQSRYSYMDTDRTTANNHKPTYGLHISPCIAAPLGCAALPVHSHPPSCCNSSTSCVTTFSSGETIRLQGEEKEDYGYDDEAWGEMFEAAGEAYEGDDDLNDAWHAYNNAAYQYYCAWIYFKDAWLKFDAAETIYESVPNCGHNCGH